MRAHPPVPPGELSPHGSPQLFPQGSSSRANTSPRSPRGTFSARLLPRELFPRGHPPGKCFHAGTPPHFPGVRFVPVIGTIVPRRQDPSKRTRNRNSDVEIRVHTCLVGSCMKRSHRPYLMICSPTINEFLFLCTAI